MKLHEACLAVLPTESEASLQEEAQAGDGRDARALGLPYPTQCIPVRLPPGAQTRGRHQRS